MVWIWKGKGEDPLECAGEREWAKLFMAELEEMARLLGEENPMMPFVFKGEWVALE